MIRVLNRNKKETKKRGCWYCANMVVEQQEGARFATRYCPYDECPYHELDDYESYEQYFKAHGKTSITKLLKALCESKQL